MDRSLVRTLLLAVASALAIGALRGRLLAGSAELGVGRDVYPLPSPERVITMSLGYRSALADMLFSHVLVSAGIHHQEKRAFEFVGNYLDTINALDPSFRDPYRYGDTLLVVQAKPVSQATYRRARDVLRRGLAAFPLDTELWESAGQFLAYLAPQQLSDPREQNEFRLEGARDLARACELVSSNENIPYHCIGAARLLSAAGEQAAALQFLQRVVSVSDNPEIREAALGYLSKVLKASEGERVSKYRDAFQRAWGRDLPFVTRGAELVLGPPWPAAECAGAQASERQRERCATSWRAGMSHITEAAEAQ